MVRNRKKTEFRIFNQSNKEYCIYGKYMIEKYWKLTFKPSFGIKITCIKITCSASRHFCAISNRNSDLETLKQVRPKIDMDFYWFVIVIVDK